MAFKKSSHCASTTCVEADTDGDMVLVRDGKNPDGGTVPLTRESWADFESDVRAGEFSIEALVAARDAGR